jgi:hypothetical protein
MENFIVFLAEEKGENLRKKENGLMGKMATSVSINR